VTGFIIFTGTITANLMRTVIPYSLFSEYDIYLFKQGKHFRIYEKMGSHVTTVEGQSGVYFSVWAPNAQSVSVVGNFNNWNSGAHSLFIRLDESGIWEGFIPGLDKGALYKYSIKTARGQVFEKGDPYALLWEIPPRTASVVWDLGYHWNDHEWMEQRKTTSASIRPYAVYEVHLPSWRKKPGTTYSLNYRELAGELVPYIKDLGFTHVEFLPVMEHPYYPSWGYQVTGYFACTSRLGTPQDFMYLVDAFHQAGIGVILDWVPSHFPTDAFGLAQFDGTFLYEHEDPRKGFHPDWKSAIFNYGRNEVRNFLISNAIFWLERFHADGLRVDAVASMLYLDYSREGDQWIPNEFGGKENLEAIAFLREFNEVAYQEVPDCITIAEESTAWSGVSRPTFTGGLGFGQKWMMGWMHDTLNYFKEDPVHRKYHHGQITFSLIYAFTENFMLPLSHDEVVHGKGSLINRMPGDEWQRFANLRLLYGYMYAHPGTKLLFMGGEFAQTSEWNIETGLVWDLTALRYHAGVQDWIRTLNDFYTSHPALYDLQFSGEGFEWIDHGDADHSIISFLRKGKDSDRPLLVVCNFTPVPRTVFRVGVPAPGKWREIINSDRASYGGAGHHINTVTDSEPIEWNGRTDSIGIQVAPLAVMIFERED
jgi:1,4-alpha-glucan branching enzyme